MIIAPNCSVVMFMFNNVHLYSIVYNSFFNKNNFKHLLDI